MPAAGVSVPRWLQLRRNYSMKHLEDAQQKMRQKSVACEAPTVRKAPSQRRSLRKRLSFKQQKRQQFVMQKFDQDGRNGVNDITKKMDKDEDSTSRTLSEDSSDFLGATSSPECHIKEGVEDSGNDICWSPPSPTGKEESKHSEYEAHNGGSAVHVGHDSCNDHDDVLVVPAQQESPEERHVRWHTSVDQELEKRRVWRLTYPPRIQKGRRVKAVMTAAQKLEAAIKRQCSFDNEDVDDDSVASSSSSSPSEEDDENTAHNLEPAIKRQCNYDNEHADDESVVSGLSSSSPEGGDERENSDAADDVSCEDAATSMLLIEEAQPKGCCHNTGPLLLPALMASYEERILLTRQTRRLGKLRAKLKAIRRQARTERTQRRSVMATAAVHGARQWREQRKRKRNTLASLAYEALDVVKVQQRLKLLQAIVIAATVRIQRRSRLPKEAAKVARRWCLQRNKRNNTVNVDIWERQRKIQVKAVLARAASAAVKDQQRLTLLQATLEAVEQRHERLRCLGQKHVRKQRGSSNISSDEIPVEILVPSDMIVYSDGADDHMSYWNSILLQSWQEL